MWAFKTILLGTTALIILLCYSSWRPATPNSTIRRTLEEQQPLPRRHHENALDRAKERHRKKLDRAKESHRKRNRERRGNPPLAPTAPPPSNSTKICLTNECIQATALKMARAFPFRTNRSEWCVSTETYLHQKQKGKYNTTGIILVKVPKAASSTAAGVALRIARKYHCDRVEYTHKPGRLFSNRHPGSFLFTSIRDPVSRIISYINFRDVSINRIRHTEQSLIQTLRNFSSAEYGSIRNGQGGFTLQFAALERLPLFSAWNPGARESVQNPQAVQATVQNLLNQYHFLLVVDRMDESLVALALLMGLEEVGDVLVTSSKTAGSYFYAPPNKCIPLSQSPVFATSAAVQAYLQSDDWKAQNYGDYLLHAAANASLDLTINQVLGRERFETALKRYLALKAREEEVCAPKAVFPCSESGKKQKQSIFHCYKKDFGCGYKCIDELIQNETLATNNTQPGEESLLGRLSSSTKTIDEAGPPKVVQEQQIQKASTEATTSEVKEPLLVEASNTPNEFGKASALLSSTNGTVLEGKEPVVLVGPSEASKMESAMQFIKFSCLFLVWGFFRTYLGWKRSRVCY